ncbi:MAG: hypothetical protein RLZ82_770 [Actinomycetota bacterium]|jgi:hypothetical protein
MKIFKSVKILAAAAALAFSLSACAPTVNLEAAPLANDPACAEVIVRLPDVVAEQTKRASNAQSTAAWGNPAAVIMRCGLEPIAASRLTCVTAGDIDWLVDDSAAPSYRFITFGRSPATEVIVDSSVVAGVTALEELAGAVQNIEATKNCLG